MRSGSLRLMVSQTIDVRFLDVAFAVTASMVRLLRTAQGQWRRLDYLR